MRILIALIATVALAALTPPLAAASGSGIDQYVEQVPGAGGNHTTGGGPGGGPGGGSNGPSSGSLPSATAQALNSQGSVGRAAAAVAAGSAPSKAHRQANGGTKNKHKHAQAGPGGAGGVSPTGSGLVTSGGPTDIGIVLPLILGMSLLAALALAILRRDGGRNFKFGSVFNRRGDVGG